MKSGRHNFTIIAQDLCSSSESPFYITIVNNKPSIEGTITIAALDFNDNLKVQFPNSDVVIDNIDTNYALSI